ncbi:MAG: shikimate dehydrogenase, partial [Clostridium sp.]
MITDGKTQVCGIIANPVEHSMSPLLQNLYAERTGINVRYVPFKVEESDVKAAIKGAFALNIRGLNVTVPHKQRVMPYLTEIDEEAEAVGAVNTLVRTETGYKGYNTDVQGLLRTVSEAGIKLLGRNCILIGAGGAAKAAAYMMAKEGATSIYLLNRSVSKAEDLATYI